MFMAILRGEDGIVTVETLVLMALVGALALATVSLTSGGVENVSGEMAQDMSDQL